MKKKIFLWMLCLPLMLAFTSCKDDDDNSNDEWRATNEAAFNAVATSTDYSPVTTPEGPGTIYKKVINSGIGTEKPLSTARVKINYKGTFYDGTVFDKSADGVPSYFPLKTSSNYSNNGAITGMSIAFQNMVIGDKWEIWIPWNLAYGAGGSGSAIPGYSTLVFEVEMLGFDQYPSVSK